MRMPISMPRRTAIRLSLAVAGSIVVHALALGIHGQGGATARANRVRAPVLHALLAPAAPDPDRATSEVGAQEQGDAAASGDRASESGAGLPSPDKWYKRSELDVLAEPMNAVKLDYPETVKARRPAQVQVRLFIDERGVVRKTAIEAAGPERAFDETAVQAWQRVRFSPAMKDGVPVKSQKVIEIDFLPELALR